MAKTLKSNRQEEKRREDFLGIASHELKTPIATIKAFAQLLQKSYKKREDDKIELYLSKIDANADRLSKIVYDLLDITRIREGKLVYRDEIIEVDEFLRGIIGELAVVFSNRRMVVIGKSAVRIRADRARIGQVLTNVIKNALYFSDTKSRVIVHVSVEDKWVRIGVQDFGVGIDEASKSEVFNLFYRHDYPEREQSSGMGVGLFISAEIIRHYGGIIGVESEVGQGSTFYFLLPVISHE